MNILTSLAIGAVGGAVSGAAVVICNYFKEKQISKSRASYEYVVPATKELYEKLRNMKTYFFTVSMEDSGCDNVRPLKFQSINVKKSTLQHVEDLKEILEKNDLFLSKRVSKSVYKLIDNMSIFMSIEISNMKDEARSAYSDASLDIENLLGLIKDDLRFYI